MDLKLPSPVEEFVHPVATAAGVRLLLKRDDLIHPEVSGNKWRKLQFNLERAIGQGQDTILTFGGAFSNHLLATAVACEAHGLQSIGIVRGEEPKHGNATLKACENHGMKLVHVPRDEYEAKEEQWYFHELRGRFGRFHLVPEGGANHWGVMGCTHLLKEVQEPVEVVALSCGTATTLAGVVLSLKESQRAIGYSALKGGDFLREDCLKHIQGVVLDVDLAEEYADSFTIASDYHFGGYAKTPPPLLDFVQETYQQYGLKLDPIYTAKAFFGLLDQIEKGSFQRGETILFIHTGGLQGVAGIEAREGRSLFT